MKTILITAMIVVVDDREDGPAPVPEPDTNPLDDLLARLLYETKKGRNPDIWSIDPHGQIFTI